VANCTGLIRIFPSALGVSSAAGDRRNECSMSDHFCNLQTTSILGVPNGSCCLGSCAFSLDERSSSLSLNVQRVILLTKSERNKGAWFCKGDTKPWERAEGHPGDGASLESLFGMHDVNSYANCTHSSRVRIPPPLTSSDSAIGMALRTREAGA